MESNKVKRVNCIPKRCEERRTRCCKVSILMYREKLWGGRPGAGGGGEITLEPKHRPLPGRLAECVLAVREENGDRGLDTSLLDNKQITAGNQFLNGTVVSL